MLIKISFDDTGKVINTFKQQHEDVGKMLNQLKAATEQLRGGDWVGKGATQFYKDMDDQLLPAVQRLQKAMQAGADHVQKANSIMNQANEDQKALYSKQPEVLSIKITFG